MDFATGRNKKLIHPTTRSCIQSGISDGYVRCVCGGGDPNEVTVIITAGPPRRHGRLISYGTCSSGLRDGHERFFGRNMASEMFTRDLKAPSPT